MVSNKLNLAMFELMGITQKQAKVNRWKIGLLTNGLILVFYVLSKTN